MYKIGRANIYFILVLALTVHLTVLGHIRIFGATPDLMLACVIFFGLFLGSAAGLESGIVSGALKDVFALDFFGINMFVFAVMGLLAGSLSANFSKESKRIRALLVMVLTAASMVLHFIFASVFSQPPVLGFTEYLASSVLPVSLYTALISIPIYVKLVNMYRMGESEEYI